MKRNGYEFSNYTSEDIDGIARIESFLWGNSEQSNKEYFIYKHQRNPFLKQPVGIVAKYEGQLAGFCGWIPAEWRMGDGKFTILIPVDAVVHPQHRRKGLFSGMLTAAMRLYCNDYRFLAVFTPTQAAAAAELKAGFKRLVARKYLRHLSWLGLARSKIPVAGGSVLEPGKFGDIEVSDRVHPVDISRIDGSNPHLKNRLCLNKSPDFLEWKLSNPHGRYAYLYHLRESRIDAYVILSLRKHHAHVFDYGEEAGSPGVKKLISFMVDRTRFASISFLDAGLPEDLRAFLRSKHFYAFDQIERIRKKESYNLPILVRPAKENYQEDDWFFDGVDIRDVNNWHITEICLE